MKKLTSDQLKTLVLNSFKAERTGDTTSNYELLDDEFKVTDMVKVKTGDYLPSLSGEKLRELIDVAFKIKGREFIFKTVIADETTQTVIVEFIESYPDPDSGKVYRTPQIAVCQVKNGKLYRTRHYMDPRLSYEFLSQDVIDKAFN